LGEQNGGDTGGRRELPTQALPTTVAPQDVVLFQIYPDVNHPCSVATLLSQASLDSNVNLNHSWLCNAKLGYWIGAHDEYDELLKRM
jgi:hypothetical protein